MEDTTALNEAARGSNTTVEDVNIVTNLQNSCDNKSANKADIKEDTVSGANKGSLKVTTHKLPVCPNVSCSPLIVDIKNKVTLLKNAFQDNVKKNDVPSTFRWREGAEVVKVIKSLNEYKNVLDKKPEVKANISKVSLIECKLCNQFFISEDEKSQHFQLLHTTKYHCSYTDCDSSFQPKLKLKYHEN